MPFIIVFYRYIIRLEMDVASGLLSKTILSMVRFFSFISVSILDFSCARASSRDIPDEDTMATFCLSSLFATGILGVGFSASCIFAPDSSHALIAFI